MVTQADCDEIDVLDFPDLFGTWVVHLDEESPEFLETLAAVRCEILAMHHEGIDVRHCGGGPACHGVWDEPCSCSCAPCRTIAGAVTSVSRGSTWWLRVQRVVWRRLHVGSFRRKKRWALPPCIQVHGECEFSRSLGEQLERMARGEEGDAPE
jgi:hypothetical protein